jgi:hypothetical protein
VLSFALVNDENEIDRIPLCEVSCVDEMIQTEFLARTDTERKPANERKPSRKTLMFQSNSYIWSEDEHGSDRTSSLTGHAFQIATDTNGYNSGRSYYLQAAGAGQKQDVINLLQKFSKIARMRAEVKSSFRKTQDRVRETYISWQFQTGAALLIVGVWVSSLRAKK